MTGPRQVLETVATELARWQTRVTDPKERKQLAEARERLEKALAPEQWVDATHLVAKHRERVLHELKGAARKLEELAKAKHRQIPDATVQGWIARILKTTRVLAAA